MLDITDVSYQEIEDRLTLVDPEQVNFLVEDLNPMTFAGSFYCNVNEYRLEDWEWYSIRTRVEFHDTSGSKKKAYCVCQSNLRRDEAHLCDHIAQALKAHYTTLFGYELKRVVVPNRVCQEINELFTLKEIFTNDQAARLFELRNRYEQPETFSKWYLADF